MRIAFLPVLALLAGGSAGGQAHANSCVKPPAPAVADKNTLSADQRNATTARIDAYIAQTNIYLACLEQADADARAEVERVIRSWEAPVDTLEIVQ